MGLLSPDEADAARDHIRQCAECEVRFRVIVADRESLRAGPVPTLVDGRIRLEPPGIARSRMWVRVGLVAAVLVVAAVSVFRLTVHERFPQYWIPVTDEAVILRSQNGKSGVADVLQSYQQHDAESAVEDLQALEPPAGDNTSATLRDLYLASALINAGRANQGLEVLDRHDIQSMPTPWRYEAEWVKYIGLRRAGRDDEAQSWLEKLSAEPGPNSLRVQAELKQRND